MLCLYWTSGLGMIGSYGAVGYGDPSITTYQRNKLRYLSEFVMVKAIAISIKQQQVKQLAVKSCFYNVS